MSLSPFPVHQLARQIGATLEGDPARPIHSVSRLAKATPQQVSFLTAGASTADISSSQAGALVVDESRLDTARDQLPDAVRLIVDDAQASFLDVLSIFHPDPKRAEIGISPTACVGASLTIGETSNLHPGATVGNRTTIGERCDIHPGAVIGDDCQLGDDVVIHPGTAIYARTIIGDRVTIHANAVIGADGFGYRFESTDESPSGQFLKIIHYGSVTIEDDVEIGAGATIDRGMIDATVIGRGTKIDNQVMVGHNCSIGPHNVFASQVGVGGSTSTGAYVRCGGQVGISDHLTIGDGAAIAAKAAVARDIPAGETQLGYPAGPESEQLRILIAQKRLPDLIKTVKTLLKRIDRLETQLADATEDGQDSGPSSQSSPRAA
ncbi:UDP-3-O-(3-hydroxymyristoyl)glucosamine N-acyltransferase [Planctomycetaceae bacterium]|nr:UDP-3-O-(3-hydroxymyristoyl)glucosamine N-acyltransferase [Planctomycetaceae bacterium]